MNDRHTGLLVVVLGTHGSGKSTLVALVNERLRQRGLPAITRYLGRAQDPRLIAPLRPAIESLAHRLASRRPLGAASEDVQAGSRLHTAAAWWYAINLAVRFHRRIRPQTASSRP